MAGRGPAPKDPTNRVRRNSDPIPLRVITAAPVSQPELPDDVRIWHKVDRDGTVEVDQFGWPQQTRDWWQMWADSPLSAEFTSTDWSFLLDTAMLHAALWTGDKSAGSELRLRVAKFGATPEDRARLRITFAAADEADEKRATPKPSSRERRGPLTSAG